MKRRSFNDRIQIVWLGKPSADRGKHPSVITSDSANLLSLINSESKRLESEVAKFDWSLLLPLIVVLGMARSSQVRTGYVDPTSPAFIEYLTALALKRADRSSLRPTINDAVKIRDRNERLFWSCNEYCSNELYNSEGGDEARWMLLANARINYMLVRGETYEANFLDEAQQLFGTEAMYLQTKFGFTIDQAVRYVNRILKLLNVRLFKQREKLVAIFENLASTKVNSTVWPVGVNVRGPRRSLSPKPGNPLDTLQEFAKGLFLISEKELMEIVGPEETASLSAFLNWISLSPGQVSGQFVSPLDANPVQDAPVVKLGNDYLFHSSSYLARCLVYSLDKQIKRDHSHINSYNRKRSRYLEDESLQLFKKIFPNDTAYQRLHYCVVQDGRKINAELDGLVQHDNSLFLIECATHPVTLASKRGVKDSIVHDIEQSIQRTFKQAKRARDYIRENEQAVFTLSDGSKVNIDAKSVKDYFLVSVTLDSFDVFAADPRKLKGLGLFNEDEYPWVIHIGNLRTLADFIEFPSQFVHYLKKRMKVPDYIYASDELDYFGCYLISNLEIPIPPAAQPIDRVLIVNATSDFDLYFSYKRGLRPRVVRPSQFIPRHLKSILLTLEKIRPPGYTDIICSLLNIDYSFRRGIEQNIVSALQRSREGNGVVRDCTVINTLEEWGFTYFCGNGQLPTNIERLLFLPEYCMHKMTQSNIYSWIGLARDTSSRRAFVSVFYSGKRDSSNQTSNDDLPQI